MRLENLVVASLSVLLLSSCATSNVETVSPPAKAKSNALLKLVKICKSETGEKWEYYNAKGLYRELAEEILYTSVDKVVPEIIKAEPIDFTGKKVTCQGTEKFASAVITELKAQVGNYGASSCQKEKYVTAIKATVQKQVTSAEPSISESNKVDILNEALAGVLNRAAIQSIADCREFAAKARQHLEALPLQTAVAPTPSPLPTPGSPAVLPATK